MTNGSSYPVGLNGMDAVISFMIRLNILNVCSFFGVYLNGKALYVLLRDKELRRSQTLTVCCLLAAVLFCLLVCPLQGMLTLLFVMQPEADLRALCLLEVTLKHILVEFCLLCTLCLALERLLYLLRSQSIRNKRFNNISSTTFIKASISIALFLSCVPNICIVTYYVMHNKTGYFHAACEGRIYSFLDTKQFSEVDVGVYDLYILAVFLFTSIIYSVLVVRMRNITRRIGKRSFLSGEKRLTITSSCARAAPDNANLKRIDQMKHINKSPNLQDYLADSACTSDVPTPMFSQRSSLRCTPEYDSRNSSLVSGMWTDRSLNLSDQATSPSAILPSLYVLPGRSYYDYPGLLTTSDSITPPTSKESEQDRLNKVSGMLLQTPFPSDLGTPSRLRSSTSTTSADLKRPRISSSSMYDTSASHSPSLYRKPLQHRRRSSVWHTGENFLSPRSSDTSNPGFCSSTDNIEHTSNYLNPRNLSSRVKHRSSRLRSDESYFSDISSEVVTQEGHVYHPEKRDFAAHGQRPSWQRRRRMSRYQLHGSLSSHEGDSLPSTQSSVSSRSDSLPFVRYWKPLRSHQTLELIPSLDSSTEPRLGSAKTPNTGRDVKGGLEDEENEDVFSLEIPSREIYKRQMPSIRITHPSVSTAGKASPELTYVLPTGESSTNYNTPDEGMDTLQVTWPECLSNESLPVSETFPQVSKSKAVINSPALTLCRSILLVGVYLSLFLPSLICQELIFNQRVSGHNVSLWCSFTECFEAIYFVLFPWLYVFSNLGIKKRLKYNEGIEALVAQTKNSSKYRMETAL